MLRNVLIALVCVACFARPASEPIRVEIGAGKALTVTIPYVNKDDVSSLVATFFGRGDDKAAALFRAKLKECSSVTLVITSAR